MDFVVRHIQQAEWPLLEDFLYEAIFVPDGFVGEVPRSVIDDDARCRAAFEGFGSRPDDRGLVAEVDKTVVGACWVRTTDEYGHIDNHTPSFCVSLKAPYRGRGIGSAMIRQMLCELRTAGYARASLSVQKQNPALRLYERLGFRIVGDGCDETEWLMVCRLDLPHSPVSLSFRRLTIEDIPLFSQMRVAQLLEEGATRTCDLGPALHDYYKRHLQDGSFVSWLALADDEVVGTSGISVVEKPPYFGCVTGRMGLVSSMFVARDFRRQGVARDLLMRVIDEARASGCGVVQITASKMGVHLYGACGFEPNDRFLQLTL